MPSTAVFEFEGVQNLSGIYISSTSEACKILGQTIYTYCSVLALPQEHRALPDHSHTVQPAYVEAARPAVALHNCVAISEFCPLFRRRARVLPFSCALTPCAFSTYTEPEPRERVHFFIIFISLRRDNMQNHPAVQVNSVGANPPGGQPHNVAKSPAGEVDANAPAVRHISHCPWWIQNFG